MKKIEIETKEEFIKYVENIQNKDMFPKNVLGWALVREVYGQINSEKVLMTHIPVLNWNNSNLGSLAVFLDVLGITDPFNNLLIDVNQQNLEDALDKFKAFMGELYGTNHLNIMSTIEAHKNITELEDGMINPFKLVVLTKDEICTNVSSVYMKLQALSEGKAPLRSLNLDGIFGLLTNCAWSNGYPFELEYIRAIQIQAKMAGQPISIDYVDKFPTLLSQVVLDDNTRVLDAKKVRFGAQLAAGTTVMPGASYVNFNAGTAGACMVEGRISSSVIVGAHTDIGGGASIAGVLSGGNTEPISIGENCLLGANSSTAISFGDGCIIDLGCAVAAGTKVKILGGDWALIKEVNPDANIEYYHKECADENTDSQCTYYVKASQLSGLNGIHFRLDSVTGGIIAFRSTFEVKLNKDLH